MLELSFDFAVAIVELVDSLKIPKSSYMTDQLARAGPSIGVNIHEAQCSKQKGLRFKIRDCIKRV